MRPLFFTLYFVLLNFSVYCQEAKNNLDDLIDNLKSEIRNTTSDSLKSEYFLELTLLNQSKKPDSAIYYGEMAYTLAEKSHNTPVQVGALGLLSISYRNRGNLPKAVDLSLKSIEMGINLPVREGAGIGPAYSNLGNIYVQIGDYDRASIYLNKLIALGRKDKVGVAMGSYYLASLYENQNKLDSALYYLKRSYEKFNNLNYGYYPKVYNVYPPWYNLRARIYLKQGKTNLALADYIHSLKMTLQSTESYFSSSTYNDIASYYQQYNQPDSAIFYAEKGLMEAKKNSTQKEILRSSEILSELYEKQNSSKALAYLKLANETRNTFYGAGNIQIMRDIIEQNDKNLAEIEATEIANRNRFLTGCIIGAALIFLITAILLFRNNRSKQKAKLKIEAAYQQLKSTQSQLIQSEKMASLGELTAGIAHEIQNPLNFVNNFSEVNKELIAEMKMEIENGDIEEVKAIANDIESNEEKINHHGKRADAIVKGMLQHSRSSSGIKEPTDINALCDEYLRLSYHGLRAKDKSFNAKFETDFDSTLPKLNVVPQDIGRVVLNLINNAFYAVNERANLPTGQAGNQHLTTNNITYDPTVTVSTKILSDKIEIRVKDNGNGIPDAIKEKIFQPFFTTKPTGQGTGLGLSLSYDIIKAHGGELKVESKVGNGSEFVIQLPV